MDSTEYLYQCSATYYNPIDSRWLPGTFTLQRNYLEFIAPVSHPNEQFHLCIPFQTISSIKKRNSRMIYAALVIQVGSESHWFSSFASRDSVYNLLELFQRSTLLGIAGTTNITEVLKSKTITPLGKRLLSILHESEETLVTTAQMLETQGQQLQEAQEDVSELNSDLSKAGKILQNLTFQPTISRSSSPDMLRWSKKEECPPHREKKKKYKVTFSDSENSQENTNEWEKGFLLLADGFKLLDQEENLRFHIPNDELQSILIVSPWEFRLTHDSSGKTTAYSVMCPMLSQLHKVISSSPMSEKISYKDDCENAFHNTSFSSTSSEASSVSTPAGCEVDNVTVQLQKHSESLTDEELHEISKVLNNLQSLASEVNKERECQVDKIKQLIDDVDRANVHINANTKDARKLM